MRITVLVENHDDPLGRGLAAEHGLSLLVETASGPFLFDMGASSRFTENACRLGHRLGDVACAAVSHGHHDHGGGLGAFLEVNARSRVFVAPGAFDVHLAQKEDGGYRSIGLDPALLERHRDRFVVVEHDVEALPGVWLLGGVRGSHPLPRDTDRFFLPAEGSHRPDGFSHELIAVMRGDGGIVVLSGCSHTGALNALERVERRFPGEPVRALVGGFHLMDPGEGRRTEPEEEIALVGRQLAGRPGLRVWTGHCTGARALAALGRELGERLAVLATGQAIEA